MLATHIILKKALHVLKWEVPWYLRFHGILIKIIDIMTGLCCGVEEE